MDPSEELVQKYLKSKYADVEFEPQGKVCPDFVIDNKIAVEVTRLNQNYLINGVYKGMEDSQSLSDGIKKLLKKKFPAKESDKCWFLAPISFRPIMEWKLLKPLLTSALNEFDINRSEDHVEIWIGDNIKLSLRPASNIQKYKFTLVGHQDLDQGGWIMSEMNRNLPICIDKKANVLTAAKQRFGHLYQEWWLIFDDHIGRGLQQEDLDEVRDNFVTKHNWDKIIILSSTSKNILIL